VKIHFNSKAVTGDKEGHYVMVKKSVHQEDITVVNILTYRGDMGRLRTTAKSESNEFFGFLVQIKVMFTLYCKLLSMQQHYV